MIDNVMDSPTSQRGFHIAHLNAQSIRNKTDELSIYVQKLKFDVFTISETWLTPSFPSNLLQIEGFSLSRLDRNWNANNQTQPKKGGGVAVYIKNDLLCSGETFANYNITSNDIECLWLEIKMKNTRNIVIGVIYRPPNGNVQVFTERLTDIANDITTVNNIDLFILGDFNINYLEKNSAEFKLLRNFENLTNLKQYIKSPTRKENCLDLIYTNCDFVSKAGVYEMLLSDHELVYISKKKSKTTYTYSYFLGRSYRNYSKDQFQHSLLDIDWDNYYLLNNVDNCWDYIIQNIEHLINAMCPLKKKKTKDKNEPWLTNELLELIHDKDLAWKQAKISKKDEDIALGAFH